MSDDEIICTACFYEIIDEKLLNELRMKNLLEANDRLICRSYLNMKRKICHLDQPNLIIVMLNPGNCGNKINFSKSENLQKEIPVKPDRTLSKIKQLFKIPNKIKWIKIINLSDIRNRKSNQFYKLLALIEQYEGINHTIFIKDSELKKHVNKKDYVIFAYGMDKRNQKLAEDAKNYLNEIKAEIINENEKNYHHPLAWNVRDYNWLETTSKLIRSRFQ